VLVHSRWAKSVLELDGSEAKLCERNAPQAHKSDENLKVVQLQESCSASKKSLSTNLSAHKWLSTVHFHATFLFYQIRRLDGNNSSSVTHESQLELEAGSFESSPPSQSESSAQPCQTLTLDIRIFINPLIPKRELVLKELHLVSGHYLLSFQNIKGPRTCVDCESHIDCFFSTGLCFPFARRFGSIYTQALHPNARKPATSFFCPYMRWCCLVPILALNAALQASMPAIAALNQNLPPRRVPVLILPCLFWRLA
jgi:hypothetical protein